MTNDPLWDAVQQVKAEVERLEALAHERVFAPSTAPTCAECGHGEKEHDALYCMRCGNRSRVPANHLYRRQPPEARGSVYGVPIVEEPDEYEQRVAAAGMVAGRQSGRVMFGDEPIAEELRMWVSDNAPNTLGDESAMNFLRLAERAIESRAAARYLDDVQRLEAALRKVYEVATRPGIDPEYAMIVIERFARPQEADHD